MIILVTGFDPFGAEKINPALETIKLLPENINGHKIITLKIPTVAYKSLDIIEKAIIKYNPDIILSIGQAAGRTDITVEKVGVNINEFRIKDNEGNQYTDEKIFENGPDAYLVKLPVKKMVENINKNGIPASVSYTAGTFVCNHVLYGVSYILEKKFKGKLNGFIHIPYLPSQVVGKKNIASMNQEDILNAIISSIEVISENEIKINTGNIC